MTTVIPGSVILTVFILISSFTFSSLLNSWESYASDYNVAQRQEEERINSSISIVSAGPNQTDLDCTNFTASVLNTGSKSIIPMTDGDVLVEYTDTSSNKIVSYLVNATTAVTGNRWAVDSFSLDNRNPSQWDSGETATIDYSISSAMKADATGPLIINPPLGSGDVEYFACPEHLYLHAETNNIAGVDYYKMVSDTTAEVTGVTISAAIPTITTGRISPSTNNGKATFLLTDSATIPAATWTATYRVKRDNADFGFVWSTNATDISLVTTGSWQDIDISGAVPIEASGAIIEVVNTVNYARYCRCPST